MSILMRLLAGAVLLSAIAACSSHPGSPAVGPGSGAAAPGADPEIGAVGAAAPTIRHAGRPLECVPYARKVSGIGIRGDAWTWWDQADGVFSRGRDPRPGAVMVINVEPKRGHLAVVKRIDGPRRIVVDHANWLNRGRIHEDTPVVDVSEANDWSRVRVWYTPGKQLGITAYDVAGFIYPERIAALQ